MKETSSSAMWDKEVTIIFCDICIKEIEAGNRPTTFFNKEGWQNIANRFKELTGREYDRLKFKNKWDQLKKEWKVWKELKRGSTGLGWDTVKRTIAASEEWWAEKIEAVPLAKKFKICGIEPDFEEKLDVMFKGVVATFQRTPIKIANDPRYMPFFQNCIGAIDGTHVDARLPPDESIAYIGRCGDTTQNVMTACDFNMCFTFAMTGWEGSAHDSRIFSFAIRNSKHCFPHPPPGKFYVVDAGYPSLKGYMKPYPNTKYHLLDFRNTSGGPRGKKEMFNHRHSSLRGVIERTFGVWKKKWVILRNMPSYPFPEQVQIVAATMAIHNFIRRHPSRSDTDFTMAADEHLNVPPEAYEFRVGRSIPDDVIGSNAIETPKVEGSAEMSALRDRITDAIFAS